MTGGSRLGENLTKSSSVNKSSSNVTKTSSVTNETNRVSENLESASCVSVEETVVIRVAPPKSVTDSVTGSQQNVTYCYKDSKNVNETKNINQSSQSDESNTTYSSLKGQSFNGQQASHTSQASLNLQASQRSQTSQSLQQKSYGSTETKSIQPKFNAQQYHSQNQHSVINQSSNSYSSFDIKQTSSVDAKSSFKTDVVAAVTKATCDAKTSNAKQSSSDAKTLTSNDAKNDVKIDVKNDAKTDTKSDIKNDVKNDAKSNVKNDFRYQS